VVRFRICFLCLNDGIYGIYGKYMVYKTPVFLDQDESFAKKRGLSKGLILNGKSRLGELYQINFFEF
jgi:hypothetical protein